MAQVTQHDIEQHMRQLLRYQHLLLLRQQQEPNNPQLEARLKPIERTLTVLEERYRQHSGSNGYFASLQWSRDAYTYIAHIQRDRTTSMRRVETDLPTEIFTDLLRLIGAARDVYLIEDDAGARIHLEDGSYALPTFIALWNLQEREDDVPWLVAPDRMLDWTTDPERGASNTLESYLRHCFGETTQIRDGVACLSSGAEIPLNPIERAYVATLGDTTPGDGRAFRCWLEALTAHSSRTHQVQRERQAIADARVAIGLPPGGEL